MKVSIIYLISYLYLLIEKTKMQLEDTIDYTLCPHRLIDCKVKKMFSDRSFSYAKVESFDPHSETFSIRYDSDDEVEHYTTKEIMKMLCDD